MASVPADQCNPFNDESYPQGFSNRQRCVAKAGPAVVIKPQQPSLAGQLEPMPSEAAPIRGSQNAAVAMKNAPSPPPIRTSD